jgi:hypothetical protein
MPCRRTPSTQIFDSHQRNAGVAGCVSDSAACAGWQRRLRRLAQRHEEQTGACLTGARGGKAQSLQQIQPCLSRGPARFTPARDTEHHTAD